MTTIALRPIGKVESRLTDLADAPRQADEGAPDACLVIDADFAVALERLKVGDEVIVITWLDRAQRDILCNHPRGDPSRPVAGVFTTRSPHRPNPLGCTLGHCRRHRGTRVLVRRLEAVDGTPIPRHQGLVEPRHSTALKYVSASRRLGATRAVANRPEIIRGLRVEHEFGSILPTACEAPSTQAPLNPCTCFVPASGVSCVSGDSHGQISSDFLDFSHVVHVQILSSAKPSKGFSINNLEITNVAIHPSVIFKYLQNTDLQVFVFCRVSTSVDLAVLHQPHAEKARRISSNREKRLSDRRCPHRDSLHRIGRREIHRAEAKDP